MSKQVYYLSLSDYDDNFHVIVEKDVWDWIESTPKEVTKDGKVISYDEVVALETAWYASKSRSAPPNTRDYHLTDLPPDSVKKGMFNDKYREEKWAKWEDAVIETNLHDLGDDRMHAILRGACYKEGTVQELPLCFFSGKQMRKYLKDNDMEIADELEAEIEA
jgi:hypothetical protein